MTALLGPQHVATDRKSRFFLTRIRPGILLVLADHAVEDRSGRALAALQGEMGIESREVVRAAIVRLEGLGLARRDGNSARTHRLSITPAGEAWLSMAGTLAL